MITLIGRDHYLGPHGAEASNREYGRLLAEQLANGRRLPAHDDDRPDYTVTEVIARYWSFAEGDYAMTMAHRLASLPASAIR